MNTAQDHSNRQRVLQNMEWDRFLDETSRDPIFSSAARQQNRATNLAFGQQRDMGEMELFSARDQASRQNALALAQLEAMGLQNQRGRMDFGQAQSDLAYQNQQENLRRQNEAALQSAFRSQMFGMDPTPGDENPFVRNFVQENKDDWMKSQFAPGGGLGRQESPGVEIANINAGARQRQEQDRLERETMIQNLKASNSIDYLNSKAQLDRELLKTRKEFDLDMQATSEGGQDRRLILQQQVRVLDGHLEGLRRRLRDAQMAVDDPSLTTTQRNALLAQNSAILDPESGLASEIRRLEQQQIATINQMVEAQFGRQESTQMAPEGGGSVQSPFMPSRSNLAPSSGHERGGNINSPMPAIDSQVFLGLDSPPMGGASPEAAQFEEMLIVQQAVANGIPESFARALLREVPEASPQGIAAAWQALPAAQKHEYAQ